MEEELEQVTQYIDVVHNFFVDYSFQILGALVVFIIGFFIAVKVSNWVLKILTKRGIDITLSRFTASGVKILIVTVVAIMALGKIGVSITPFVAALGAISLGVGLAMQGLLSNYGAGICIIVTRPFIVGDTISVQGVSGIVKEVHLGSTLLTNEDNATITIPNKHIVGEIIHNSKENSIVEITVGIAYDAKPEFAVSTIVAAINGVDGVAKDKKPQVGIDNFGDSSIDIGVRFWTKTESFFQTKYQVNMAIFNALAEQGIEIPFPQRTVHMVSNGV